MTMAWLPDKAGIRQCRMHSAPLYGQAGPLWSCRQRGFADRARHLHGQRGRVHARCAQHLHALQGGPLDVGAAGVPSRRARPAQPHLPL